MIDPSWVGNKVTARAVAEELALNCEIRKLLVHRPDLDPGEAKHSISEHAKQSQHRLIHVARRTVRLAMEGKPMPWEA